MKSVRSDLNSEMYCKSGCLIVMPLENFQELVGYSEDEDPEIVSTIINNGGDIVTIDGYVNLEIRKKFTLNEDGTNNTIVQIAPKTEHKEFVRMLNKNEKTLEEYALQRKKEQNLSTEEMIGVFTDIKNQYIEEMNLND